MENLDLGVITGEKSLKIEAKVTDDDLLKIGAVLFVALFFSVLFANLITRK